MPQLRILDSITDRGDPRHANEDACGGGRNQAFVIDGATGLGAPFIDPTCSDAAWLARFAKDCFEDKKLSRSSVAELVRTVNLRVREVAAGMAHGDAVEPWNLPVAGFQMVRVENDRVVTYGLGDCRLFLLAADGEALDATAIDNAAIDERDGARRAIDHAGGLAAIRALSAVPAVRDELRARRARYNRADGTVWTLGTEPEAARHLVARDLFPALPAHGLLCSDGFAALADLYGRYDGAGLVRAALDQGLTDLLRELRTIERREDPDGRAYPRFKVSDDATALLFAIVA